MLIVTSEFLNSLVGGYLMSQGSCTQVVSITKYQSRIIADNFQNNMEPVKTFVEVLVFFAARDMREK